MSILYKDGNGNIDTVAGTNIFEISNTLRQYINDQNELDVEENFEHLNAPAPFDGICTLRHDVRRTGISQGYSINGIDHVTYTSGMWYDSPFTYYRTFRIKKGDIVKVFGQYVTIIGVQYYKKRDYSMRA